MNLDDGEYDSVIMARHYTSLDKEQRKTKPNKAVINKYLNLELASRRRLLEITKKEARPGKIFEAYPCFKDPVEVLNYA